MKSAGLCYAAEDADFARELSGFLKLNCTVAVSCQEGLIGPGEDLVDAAERSLSADYALILLSPHSIPNALARSRWEPVLVHEARKAGTQLAYVLLRDCKFPQVFRREPFFDLSEHRLSGQRALKRRLLSPDLFLRTAFEVPEISASEEPAIQALEHLECRLADQPGVEAEVPRELALAFAHSSTSDFEGVFWLNCANRSSTGILGDIAQLLQLKLRGTQEQNAQALREFCAERRLLFVFEHIVPGDRELVGFGAKTSVIFVAKELRRVQRSLTETAALFCHWRTDCASALSAMGDAEYHLRKLPDYSHEDWRIAISLGLAASSCLRHADRLAEIDELLNLMIDSARSKADQLTIDQLEWEQSWILEEWGVPIPARSRPIAQNQPNQLSLGLGE